MSLSSTISGAVKKAFDSLDDLVGDIIITKPGAYDPQSGDIGVLTSSTFTGLFVDVEVSSYKNSGVGLGNKVCLVQPNTSNPDPEVGDSVTGVDGIKWVIVQLLETKPYSDNYLWELLVKS